MTRHHGDDYTQSLQAICTDNTVQRCRGADCAVLAGLSESRQSSPGGPEARAGRLDQQQSGIAVIWRGLHHAKKSASSAFCCSNAVVLAILGL